MDTFELLSAPWHFHCKTFRSCMDKHDVMHLGQVRSVVGPPPPPSYNCSAEDTTVVCCCRECMLEYCLHQGARLRTLILPPSSARSPLGGNKNLGYIRSACEQTIFPRRLSNVGGAPQESLQSSKRPLRNVTGRTNGGAITNLGTESTI